MANIPFWEQSLSALTFDGLAQFIKEDIPENHHLEYKRASFNTQNRKHDFDPRFLRTIVSFANGSGGMVIYGIKEDGHERPEAIEGEPPIGNEYRPLEKAIRDMCAARIEPTVHLDTKVLRIPEGLDYASNQVLLIRVRPGSMAPYHSSGRGYLRPWW